MTTAVLLTSTRSDLTQFDLDTIREFAREAPWEWKIALEELVDIAEKYDDQRDYSDELDNLTVAVTTGVEKLEGHLIGLREIVRKMSAAHLKAAMPFLDGIEEVLADLKVG